MSTHLVDLPVPIYKTTTSPLRPKHQTSRSITEASFVPKLHRPHHHHTHISRYHKEKDKGGPSSDNPNLLSDGGTKSEGVTPEDSRAPSRQTSLRGLNVEIDGLVLPLSWREERRVVKEGELGEEKERGALRATELHNALSTLNTVSNNHTRRLDNTYYSVLEKLSALQATVTLLKELASMTRELNVAFERESKEVVMDIEESLAGFRGFEAQQGRIETLAERVKMGREKIKTLGNRVEVVRRTVDGWEKNELEWQERTRRRLKVLWIIIAVGGVVFLGLVAFQYTPARTQGPGVFKGMNASDPGRALPDFLNETWTLKRSTPDGLEKLKAQSAEQDDLEEDPRLRVFDEL